MHTLVPPSDGAEESATPKPSHVYYRYNLHVPIHPENSTLNTAPSA